ncbi:SRPBCC family protein [Ferrovibrio sp.]|uniref:aromatic ring-hydroxylating oxygenase subunit alpha n=1 Tax=Ferrovibrio sp. TaxID=1917215 RepID=UPI000CA8F3E7|nr:SRPBCC family protein [Ferrovibrio sp.]PJI37303.1 MAG: ferredoxin [Ferrovibrio sp.]
MDHAPHLAQFRRLLALVRRERDENLAQPFYIRPNIYWRPERLQLEMQRVFRRAPLVLGHAAMLPKAGDTLVMDVLGQPLLIARGRDGTIRGFLNVCRHRGTRLCNTDNENGITRQSQFTCPYHNWVYDLDGRLKHVPLEAEGFPGLDKARFGLTPIPLAVREGMIFGIIDPDVGAMDLDGFLAGIDQDLSVFGFGQMQFYAAATTKRKTNWKLIIDAFQESYHVSRLHRSTVGPFFLDNCAVIDSLGPHSRAVVARTEFAEIAALPERDWDARRHSSFAYMLFPNTILVLHPDYTSILTMLPVAADETLFRHVMLVPQLPQDEKTEAHYRRSFDLIEGGVFQAEDLHIAEQAQIGMASGANRTMIYGRFESGIRRFHETLDEWLGTSSVSEMAE